VRHVPFDIDYKEDAERTRRSTFRPLGNMTIYNNVTLHTIKLRPDIEILIEIEQIVWAVLNIGC
jgi:hypothetical protein